MSHCYNIAGQHPATRSYTVLVSSKPFSTMATVGLLLKIAVSKLVSIQAKPGLSTHLHKMDSIYSSWVQLSN